MGISVSAADRDVRPSIVLRAALAMPLLYILLRTPHAHWSWMFPSGQASDFYAINGLLYAIPIAVWCAALVLLAVGSGNRVAWVVLGIGGGLVALYGLLAVLRVETSLNSYLAFGTYVLLLALWQLLGRRDRERSPRSEPQAQP